MSEVKQRYRLFWEIAKQGEIAVNVILPFAFSWGELANEAKLTENAIELYRNYPKLAENCITRHMKKQLGFEEPIDLAACHQQGLDSHLQELLSRGKMLTVSSG